MTIYKKGDYRYNMTEEMAQSYLNSIKDKKAKGNKQKVLCDWINTEFGIKGNCVEVTFSN